MVLFNFFADFCRITIHIACYTTAKESLLRVMLSRATKKTLLYRLTNPSFIAIRNEAYL